MCVRVRLKSKSIKFSILVKIICFLRADSKISIIHTEWLFSILACIRFPLFEMRGKNCVSFFLLSRQRLRETLSKLKISIEYCAFQNNLISNESFPKDSNIFWRRSLIFTFQRFLIYVSMIIQLITKTNNFTKINRIYQIQ